MDEGREGRGSEVGGRDDGMNGEGKEGKMNIEGREGGGR